MDRFKDRSVSTDDYIALAAQVSGRNDVVPFGAETLDEMRAEEPVPTGDEDAAHLLVLRSGVIQSTRPTHRARFSAYQRIVLSTPSSHDTRRRR